MQVWQSVKAKPSHPRGGDETGAGAQAGKVTAIDPAHPDQVVVEWDVDGVNETTAIADLTALSHI